MLSKEERIAAYREGIDNLLVVADASANMCPLVDALVVAVRQLIFRRVSQAGGLQQVLALGRVPATAMIEVIAEQTDVNARAREIPKEIFHEFLMRATKLEGLFKEVRLMLIDCAHMLLVGEFATRGSNITRLAFTLAMNFPAPGAIVPAGAAGAAAAGAYGAAASGIASGIHNMHLG